MATFTVQKGWTLETGFTVVLLSNVEISNVPDAAESKSLIQPNLIQFVYMVKLRFDQLRNPLLLGKFLSNVD